MLTQINAIGDLIRQQSCSFAKLDLRWNPRNSPPTIQSEPLLQSARTIDLPCIHGECLSPRGLPNDWPHQASAGKTAAFAHAQSLVLANAPKQFTMDHPPSVGWWKAKFDLPLPAAVLVSRYQSLMARKRWWKRDGSWFAWELAPVWQADCGVTPSQWGGATKCLGAASINLLRFASFAVGSVKGTGISPTEIFLAVFGCNLAAFDAERARIENERRNSVPSLANIEREVRAQLLKSLFSP